MAKKIYMIIFLLFMTGVFVCMIKNIIFVPIYPMFGEADIEEILEKAYPQKGITKELYGWTNKFLSPNEIDRTVKDEDGYLRPVWDSGYKTDYAAGRISELSDFCKENNVEFAYISYPSKSDSTDTGAIYGIDSNMDLQRAKYLNKIDEYGIEILNVREQLENEGLTRKEIFYKTDHHWNTRAGLFAARSISQFLYDKGYNTDPELLEEDKFTYDVYKNCWFGETGRKYSVTWVGGLDDFTVIKPKYETSLDYIVENSFERSGDFSILFNEESLSDIDLYRTSLHYSYMPEAGPNSIVRNNNFEDGAKVLIIHDSYSIVVVPFLALGCGEVNMWDLRDNDASLYDYIKNNDFDIVLLAYTDFFRNDMYDFH